MSHTEPVRHVYLRSDLRNIMLAVAIANNNNLRSSEYNEGFRDALASLSAGLNIEPPLLQHTITIEQPAHFEGV